ncbi:hypothetical protein CPB84DRAFT_1691756, partial [Gymnopilus junonius]
VIKALFDSISAEHCPTLSTDYKPNVSTLMSGSMTLIGTMLIPFILTDNSTGKQIRVVLHAIVLPNLFINMVIGISGGEIIRSMAHSADRPLLGFNFGQGEDGVTYVRGI